MVILLNRLSLNGISPFLFVGLGTDSWTFVGFARGRRHGR